MGCGEMSAAQFEAFLRTALGHAATHSDDGAIHFVCMHWAKIRELLGSTADLYSETKNLCVWSKTNAGMGSLYRSRHELIFVFKRGDAPHINNIELGRFGRNRTNVWDYPGQNVLNGTSKSKLSLHPTVKPVACRRCDSGLFQPQRRHPRSFRGRRHHLDRRREDGAQSLLDRD